MISKILTKSTDEMMTDISDVTVYKGKVSGEIAHLKDTFENM